MQALQVVPDKIKVVREFVRVLKAGGKAAFAEPLAGWHFTREFGYIFWKLGIKVLSLKYTDLRHLNRRDYAGEYFTATSLENLLITNGFQNVSVKKMGLLLLATCSKGA